MKSEHIDNRRLYDVVVNKVVLEEAEVLHLSSCDECLEMIRVFVHQTISKE
jgi:hypothetical protein